MGTTPSRVTALPLSLAPRTPVLLDLALPAPALALALLAVTVVTEVAVLPDEVGAPDPLPAPALVTDTIVTEAEAEAEVEAEEREEEREREVQAGVVDTKDVGTALPLALVPALALALLDLIDDTVTVFEQGTSSMKRSPPLGFKVPGEDIERESSFAKVCLQPELLAVRSSNEVEVTPHTRYQAVMNNIAMTLEPQDPSHLAVHLDLGSLLLLVPAHDHALALALALTLALVLDREVTVGQDTDRDQLLAHVTPPDHDRDPEEAGQGLHPDRDPIDDTNTNQVALALVVVPDEVEVDRVRLTAALALALALILALTLAVVLSLRVVAQRHQIVITFMGEVPVVPSIYMIRKRTTEVNTRPHPPRKGGMDDHHMEDQEERERKRNTQRLAFKVRGEVFQHERNLEVNKSREVAALLLLLVTLSLALALDLDLDLEREVEEVKERERDTVAVVALLTTAVITKMRRQ